jgi:hypothetical protein
VTGREGMWEFLEASGVTANFIYPDDDYINFIFKTALMI